MGQSNEKLIKEILRGNESAMELLIKKHYNMVQNFVYRFVGDYSVSYDLTQEIFIKMMKNLNRYKFNSGTFEGWILKIASNQCKDYFKSNTYKQRNETQDVDEIQIESKDRVINMMEKNEERKNVKKALEELPPMQREAIILKYYEELKIKEISDVTGVNENTVKSRIFNGIKNLKKIIGGDDIESKETV